MEILKEWHEVERVSAYDDDDVYYVKVEFDGEVDIFKDNIPFTDKMIDVRIKDIKDQRQKKNRKYLLIDKYKRNKLTKNEALELLEKYI